MDTAIGIDLGTVVRPLCVISLTLLNIRPILQTKKMSFRKAHLENELK